MEFVPISAAWEITMACNMRCKHCGSGCTDRRPDELTTEEALRLCDDLAEIGVKFVGLSGGDPLLRSDWPLIARRLTGHGMVVSMVSNGWLIDEQVINKALSSGLDTIGVSLDGLKETHDAIRRKGAFARALNALLLMKEKGFPSSVITTVMKQNLSELPELKKILEKRGVDQWQIQMGIPMGSLQHNLDDVIDPFQLSEIIDFTYGVMKEGKISTLLANSIGYYTDKSVATREAASGPGTVWSGCYAGKTSLGILHDGRIVGCFFLKDDEFVEGSIRETSLREIWSRPGAFAWNREMNREKLTGFCRKCRYGDTCLGGCSTLKHFTGGTLSENTYCAFRTSMEQLIPKINRIQDVETLVARAEKSMNMKLYEVAEMCLCRALEISPANVDILNKLRDVSSFSEEKAWKGGNNR